MANTRKAGGRKKAYYTTQKSITTKHKTAGKAKRAKKLQAWILKGVKKNGKPVLSLEQRKIRSAQRLLHRHALKAERRQQKYGENRGYHTHVRKSSDMGVEEAS